MLDGLDVARRYAGALSPQEDGFHEDLAATSWPINGGP
jgi:hypothetical protein